MIVLITGGSSGLGRAITCKLAADPNNSIFFTYHQSENKAREIEAAFPNSHAIRCSFSIREDVNQLSEKLSHINPDVLINNVYFGKYLKTHFHKIAPADFLLDFEENVIPTVILTQSAIRCFRKKKSGKLITVLTSALINIPPVGSAVYTANKAYLQQLTKVWAAENAKYNIVSNSVSPAFMLTDFTKDTDERILHQMQEEHPLKQLLNVAETAEAVFFLANASHQINGIDLVINAAKSIK